MPWERTPTPKMSALFSIPFSAVLLVFAYSFKFFKLVLFVQLTSQGPSTTIYTFIKNVIVV